jgi:hypothetical protein
MLRVLLPLQRQIELLARITQSIAFVLGTFMAVTFTVFPNRRRQFFVRLVVYASWGLSLSLVRTSIYYKYSCKCIFLYSVNACTSISQRFVVY